MIFPNEINISNIHKLDPYIKNINQQNNYSLVTFIDSLKKREDKIILLYYIVMKSIQYENDLILQISLDKCKFGIAMIYNIFYYCVMNQSFKAVLQLVKMHSIDINYRVSKTNNIQINKFLQPYIAMGNLNIFELLVHILFSEYHNRVIDINIKTYSLTLILNELFKTIITQYHIDINHIYCGDTILHTICSFISVNDQMQYVQNGILNIILKHPKIDVNILNYENNPPIYEALKNKNKTIIRSMLLYPKLDWNIYTSKGVTCKDIIKKYYPDIYKECKSLKHLKG